MNRENKFFKLILIAGYVFMLLYSTWATAESLHLWVPNVPIPIWWVLAGFIYFVASYGTKMIFRSFNHTERIEGRFKMLIGGIVLLLLFWGCFILPTNTHTFFYNSVIKKTALQELPTTKQNLIDLETSGHIIINNERDAFNALVHTDIGSWKSEILNIGDPGAGVRAETILGKIALNIGDINRLTLRSKKQADLIGYSKQMVDQMEAKLKIKSDEIYGSKLRDYDATINPEKLKSLENRIDNEIEFVKINDKVRSSTKDVLIESDAIINKYTEVLQKSGFKTTSLIKNNTTPKIVELEDIVQVWKNYFHGDYKAQGFTFWILLAALIDITGFILYTVASKQNENY